MSMRQFVTFKVDGCLFGLDVLSVREINRATDITPVPHSPDYVCGLINLRGQTVTTFDLGVRLGMGPRSVTQNSCNIILKGEPLGLLVDEIGDVAQAEAHEIDPPPANVENVKARFMEGVLQLKDQLLLIVSASAIAELESSLAQSPEESGAGSTGDLSA